MLSRSTFKVPLSLLVRSSLPTLVRSSTSGATTTKQTSAEEYEILRSQRKNRPLAPHLSIYKPQLTWYGSAANRITGVSLSAAIYAYFAVYALGFPVDVGTVAATFGSLPVAAKVAVKSALAVPFFYHSWNGLRHLTWDTGKALDIKNVYRTGYAVIALTVVTSLWAISV